MVPCPEILTTCVVFVATNLYHTSLCVPPVSQPAGKPVEAAAFTTVPPVLTQVSAEVSVVAVIQSSFDGGGNGLVTHILNPPLLVTLLPIFETLI